MASFRAVFLLALAAMVVALPSKSPNSPPSSSNLAKRSVLNQHCNDLQAASFFAAVEMNAYVARHTGDTAQRVCVPFSLPHLVTHRGIREAVIFRRACVTNARRVSSSFNKCSMPGPQEWST